MAKLKEAHKKELTDLNSKIDSVANNKNKEYESAIKRVRNLEKSLDNFKVFAKFWMAIL
jgi:hypothetical protein